MEFVSDVLSQSTHQRASFFELYAQEELRSLLSPVIRYLLSVLAAHFPRYFLRIENAHDELFATYMYFVERHYLKNWGATFAENFYGLKRKNRLPRGDSSAVDESLSDSQVRTSALVEVLIPYIQAKASNYHEDLAGAALADDENAFDQQRPLRARLQDAFAHYFKKLYPYFTLAYRAWILVYNIRYIYGRSPYWRPWFRLMGLHIQRLSLEDYQEAQTKTASMIMSPFKQDPTGASPPLSRVAMRSLFLVPSLIFEALKIVLPTSIFFFRFLEWWYSSDGVHARTRPKNSSNPDDLSLLPPEKPKLPGNVASTPMNICPVHRGEIVNPTALPSGYVGCYKCLYNYVQESGECPLTGSRVDVSELRKIRV